MEPVRRTLAYRSPTHTVRHAAVYCTADHNAELIRQLLRRHSEAGKSGYRRSLHVQRKIPVRIPKL